VSTRNDKQEHPAGEIPGGDAMQEPGKNMQIEELKAEIKEARETAAQYLDSLTRIQADFDNFRKIKDREREQYMEHANARLLCKLLSHVDDLEKGLEILESTSLDERVKSGIRMIKHNFENLLVAEGVSSMNCEGQQFDPNKHEAILVMESADLDEDTIVQEVQKGYYYKKKVLRPARVIVSRKPVASKYGGDKSIKKEIMNDNINHDS
jgi:molecular chaperone GrpE